MPRGQNRYKDDPLVVSGVDEWLRDRFNKPGYIPLQGKAKKSHATRVPVPKENKTVNVSVRLRPDTKQAAIVRARAEGRTLANFIAHSVTRATAIVLSDLKKEKERK